MKSSLQSWKTAFFDAFERVEADSARQTAEDRRELDLQIIGLIILVCVVLSFMEYYGGSNDYGWLESLAGLLPGQASYEVQSFFRDREYGRLARLGYWSMSTFVGYALLPGIYVRFVMKKRLTDIGLSLKGALEHWWVYAGMYVLVLPAVYAVSFTESFQNTYPFYGSASRSWFDFLAWEGLYALQFLSLEFFFRGVLIHGIKKRFGFYAILVSVIPYCMIHFGKPMPETIGAILAGLALGVLSLYTRSIWLGVAIHISVAVTMDILSMLAKGQI
ncbi:MAG: CPBP family glutamic-type intramembrane protease [Myxococcota bacterium]